MSGENDDGNDVTSGEDEGGTDLEQDPNETIDEYEGGTDNSDKEDKVHIDMESDEEGLEEEDDRTEIQDGTIIFNLKKKKSKI